MFIGRRILLILSAVFVVQDSVTICWIYSWESPFLLLSSGGSVDLLVPVAA